MACKNCGRYIGSTRPAWVIYDSDEDREYCSFECLKQHDPGAAFGFDEALRSGDAFYRPPVRRWLETTAIL